MEPTNTPPSSSTVGGIDKRINLHVGERVFVTTKNTLKGESSYFSALFSGRWPNQDISGTYFIESDPVIFAEVLRYLRSGNFPLYFDANTSTYDYGRYANLLGEAHYFGITRLED
ncbi:BTB/POZ protein [Xylariaceae sp. FL1019]|nr:BTB/POZ protein [Xylariaceae sp. FL1019]